MTFLRRAFQNEVVIFIVQTIRIIDVKNIVPKGGLAGQYFRTGLGIKKTEALCAIDWVDGISGKNLNLKIIEQVISF